MSTHKYLFVLFSVISLFISNGCGSSEKDKSNMSAGTTKLDRLSDEAEPFLENINEPEIRPDLVEVIASQHMPSRALESFIGQLEYFGVDVQMQMIDTYASSRNSPAAVQIFFKDADDSSKDLREEGFRIEKEWRGEQLYIYVTGKPQTGARVYGNIGLAFGAYRLLEQLDFRFLHPLRVIRPAQLDWLKIRNIETSPRWQQRKIHLHTMHPLELTDLLQGLDAYGTTDKEGFLRLLPEWHQLLGWLLANGRNATSWVLLRMGRPNFDYSLERFERIKMLVDIAHAYGLKVGIGLPLSQKQQHAWRLVENEDDPLDVQLSQIRERARLALDCGFDRVGAALGSSEFTESNPEKTLAWMNALAELMDHEYNSAQLATSAHITAGQDVALDGDGTEAGEDVNFNFISRFADDRIVTSVHTVQHYALDDRAPTYGNEDFTHMRQYLREEAGKRKVSFSAETAYWVSFDIDVPLFLPIYAERRFHDIRLIADDEENGLMGQGEYAGSRIYGQSNFSTGWEWGYWLNDVVAAKSAWDPLLEYDEARAFRELLRYIFEPFDGTEDLVDWITEVADMQHEVLIEGMVDERRQDHIKDRNGQAYLQGTETWDEVSELAEEVPSIPIRPTQPTRLDPHDLMDPRVYYGSYNNHVRPLLREMRTRFEHALANYRYIYETQDPVDDEWLNILNEFYDGAAMNYLRATQVENLYAYGVNPLFGRNEQALDIAEQTLDEALLITKERSNHYRVPKARIASWRENPTAYPFGYLWTADTLFYWWRDEGKFKNPVLNPCYLNILNPAKIALGEDSYVSAADVAAEVFDRIPGLGHVSPCLEYDVYEPNLLSRVR